MCFKRIANVPQRFTNVWRARIHGRDKSASTAADSLPIMLLTDCNNTTFKKQKPYFCNVKTILLKNSNHTTVKSSLKET
ncbi:hypothetical protein [Prevotella pallens]|uniref:hypothetical protein n=1 Tax=Prevotella pallens TaxID=60133 RepID=UPI0023F324E8|nr:hypothetical protein [Prevotella pallens]